MANKFATGAAWLAAKLKAHASVEVTYTRASDSVTLQATLGSKLLKVSDDVGRIEILHSDRDFIVNAAELILGGDVVLPAKGDEIRMVVGSDTEVYRVCQPGGEPEYQLDPQGVRLRIHSERVGTE